MTVQPFRINVPAAVLDDLQGRLQKTRFARGMFGADWDCGTSPAYLVEFCGYWRSFPNDLSSPSREWAERFFNVQRWAQMPRGGHFGAMEQPALLAEELRSMFAPLAANAPRSNRPEYATV
jgi:hypothetical protein